MFPEMQECGEDSSIALPGSQTVPLFSFFFYLVLSCHVCFFLSYCPQKLNGKKEMFRAEFPTAAACRAAALLLSLGSAGAIYRLALRFSLVTGLGRTPSPLQWMFPASLGPCPRFLQL